MRILYIALIIALTGRVILFRFRNLQSVTISLLAVSLTLPAAMRSQERSTKFPAK